MTLAWMLYVLLVSTLIACGAVALEGLVRRTRAPVRLVWAGALVAVALVTLFAPRDSARIVDVPALSLDGPARLTIEPTRSSRFLDALAAARAGLASSMAHVIGRLNARLPASSVSAVQVAWLAASTGVMLLLLGVSIRMRRARRAWPRAEVAGTMVRIAPGVGPAVIGVARPEIVLPQWMLSRSESEQRIVVVHEREHVAARDHLLLIAAWGVAAALPWVPAVWFMMTRLRLAIELDCDARVLARGILARPYGELLIDIAGAYAGHRVGALALADKTSHLERRLVAMRTSTRPTVTRTTMLAGVAALSILMACEARLPTTAEVETMNVADVESRATKSGLLDGKDKAYYVDGVLISASTAFEIKTDSIATIEIRKAATASALNEIHISTTKGRAFPVEGRRLAPLMRESVSSDSLPIAREGRLLLPKSEFLGIILIDGIRATEAQMKALSAGEIVAVNVRKGAAAAALSVDPAAKYGVIEMTTVRAANKP